MAKQPDAQKIIDSLPSLELKDIMAIKEKCEKILEEKKKEFETGLSVINGGKQS